MERQDAGCARAEPVVTRRTREGGSSRFAWLAEPRSLRARWLAALTRMLDGGLRSPVFLVCMRYGLAATLEARALQDGFWGRRPARRGEAPPR